MFNAQPTGTVISRRKKEEEEEEEEEKSCECVKGRSRRRGGWVGVIRR